MIMTMDDIMCMQLDAYIDDVTDGIVEGVKRLQEIGVSKVLVNSMPPLGCSPWRARQSVGYAQCDGAGNTLATTHNRLLRRKLDGLEDVHVLDLYNAFNSLARSMSGTYVRVFYASYFNSINCQFNVCMQSIYLCIESKNMHVVRMQAPRRAVTPPTTTPTVASSTATAELSTPSAPAPATPSTGTTRTLPKLDGRP